jgi:hypothetical protein
MKLPISFGNKLFFRVLLPGAILTAAFARISQAVLQLYGLKLPIAYAFPVETLLFGWFMLVLDTPVYMLFEGRRFWPTSLFALGRRRERARLVSLLRRMRRYDSDRLPSAVPRGAREKADRIYPEAAVDLSGFALDRVTSMPRVIWPTRLGDLIAAYEVSAPKIRVGCGISLA